MSKTKLVKAASDSEKQPHKALKYSFVSVTNGAIKLTVLQRRQHIAYLVFFLFFCDPPIIKLNLLRNGGEGRRGQTT